MGCCSTILTALPGDHLSLTRAPGSKYWRIPPDARSPPNFEFPPRPWTLTIARRLSLGLWAAINYEPYSIVHRK
jgi:hypothetical protein